MENLNKLATLLKSGAQGASNTVAGTVYVPVDTLAYVLRKYGVKIPDDPVGGEKWMRDLGLIVDPENHQAGVMGSALTMAIPGVVKGPKK